MISGPYHWSINVFFLMLNVLWLLFVSRHLEKHMTIPWLMAFKKLEGQMVRWLNFLNTYDFEIP